MGKLQKNAAEYDYKEYERDQTEEFSSGLDDEGMINEILREVSLLEDINDAISERILLWTWRIEAHRLQKETLDNMKEAKDLMQSDEMHKDKSMRHMGNRNR